MKLEIELSREGALGSVVTWTFDKGPGAQSFDIPYDLLKTAGRYLVKPVKVITASNCEWKSDESFTENNITFDIISRPQIRFSGQSKTLHDLCVGDVAKFELTGSGPWLVDYSVGMQSGIRKYREKISSGRLNILLAEAGKLEITQLCDRLCCSSPSEIFFIRPLPSANIVDGISYIHEGDSASFQINLTGTPPFSLVYHRLNESNSVPMETISLDGIIDYSIDVKVGKSGIFKVAAVKDSYCSFPRKDNKA